jgi:hypothetical protein
MCGVMVTSNCMAAQLVLSGLPAGYTTSSIELGQPFGGALVADPANTDRLYVAAGFFGNQSILRVTLSSGTTSTVATGFGSIGGIAVLGNNDLAVTENFTSQGLFRARDLNSDNDFLDAGEVTELIAPILADSGATFTGAQVTVARAGNAAAIPAGSLIVQTADGGTSAELLVVQNPTTAPGYRPTGGAFFGGFAYNGGVAFDAAGNVIMGESVIPGGRVYALVNSNADQAIGAGESHVLADTAAIPDGIADLAVSADGRVFYGGNGPGFSPAATLMWFQLPGNLLTGSGTPAVFANTNSTYLSAVRFDEPTRSFVAAAGGNTARLLVSGLDGTFAGFTNVMVVRPSGVSGVGEWEMY